MATTRTAAPIFLFLASTFFCAPVWAQSPADDLRQFLAEAMEQSRRDSQSLAKMAAAMERLAQGNPTAAPAAQPAAQPAVAVSAVPQGGCDPANCLTREEWNQFLANDFAPLKKRVARVESLVGRIAPRHDAPTTAPKGKPASSSPVAQASSSGPGVVKVTELPKEQFRSVAFTGDIPNPGDIAGIKRLLGAYDMAQEPIVLPTPGKDDSEKAVHAAARGAALQAAWGSWLATRAPTSEVERDQLVAGAPAGTGVVFHLRLKKPVVAATPATP